MTKEEIIEKWKEQGVKGNEEIMVSIINEADPDGPPSVVPIDYIGGMFINVTF